MKKKPLTARIDPFLYHRLEIMQNETGKDRTACLESALAYFFENCPDYSTVQPPVNQELVQALRDALQSPEIMQVIQKCITQVNPIIQPCDTVQEPEKRKDVIQKRITKKPAVPQKRVTVSRSRITEADARELVERVRGIQEREGCNIDKACERAGISNKKYYNRVHFLEGL